MDRMGVWQVATRPLCVRMASNFYQGAKEDESPRRALHKCTVKCMLLQKGAVNYCGCISRIEGAYIRIVGADAPTKIYKITPLGGWDHRASTAAHPAYCTGRWEQGMHALGMRGGGTARRTRQVEAPVPLPPRAVFTRHPERSIALPGTCAQRAVRPADGAGQPGCRHRRLGQAGQSSHSRRRRCRKPRLRRHADWGHPVTALSGSTPST